MFGVKKNPKRAAAAFAKAIGHGPTKTAKPAEPKARAKPAAKSTK